jgi:hypothetical protein
MSNDELILLPIFAVLALAKWDIIVREVLMSCTSLGTCLLSAVRWGVELLIAVELAQSNERGLLFSEGGFICSCACRKDAVVYLLCADDITFAVFCDSFFKPCAAVLLLHQ